MRVLLVRHAHAGSKARWTGDDRRRPLSAKGRRDARRLARLLSSFEPEAVFTSPYRRCVQTVEPLVTRHPVPVEAREELVPETGDKAAELVYELVGRDGGTVVVCSHGETITDVLAAVAAADGVVGPDAPNEKGSLWVFDPDGGRIGAARYLPPGTTADVGARR